MHSEFDDYFLCKTPNTKPIFELTGLVGYRRINLYVDDAVPRQRLFFYTEEYEKN